MWSISQQMLNHPQLLRPPEAELNKVHYYGNCHLSNESNLLPVQHGPGVRMETWWCFFKSVQPSEEEALQQP